MGEYNESLLKTYIMGTIKKGIIGGFAGKVGPVIGSSWKGIPYLKARPEKVANPRTAGQLDHRARLTTTVHFLSPMKELLRAGFCEMAIRMTEFNAAMSYNYHHALKGIYPALDIDYPKVLISQGTLCGALHPQVRAGAGQLVFSWQNNADNMQVMDTDRVMLLAYHPGLHKAVFLTGGNTRDIGSQSIDLPSVFQGQELHCYIAFQNTERTAASSSQYLGILQAI
jgi:hypothetical protein